MRFIKLDDLSYPLSALDVMRLNPNTSFAEHAEEFEGFARVVEIPPPAVDEYAAELFEDPPALVAGQWFQQWNVRPLDPEVAAQRVASAKASMMAALDDEVAAVLSRSTRFAIGYTEREGAAKAFKQNGYVGDPSIWVTRFARNTGMTDQAAADLILSQANNLRGALEQLEALRMDKYKIQAAPTMQLARESFEATRDAIAAIAAMI